MFRRCLTIEGLKQMSPEDRRLLAEIILRPFADELEAHARAEESRGPAGRLRPEEREEAVPAPGPPPQDGWVRGVRGW